MTTATVPTAVVDASAVAALLFGEPRAGEVAQAIDGCNLIAPRLLRYEIISVGMKKIRGDPALRRAVEIGLSRFSALAIHESDVPPPPVLDLALATGLSAYDASYLWLAQSQSLQMVTLDATLQRAAGAWAVGA